MVSGILIDVGSKPVLLMVYLGPLVVFSLLMTKTAIFRASEINSFILPWEMCLEKTITNFFFLYDIADKFVNKVWLEYVIVFLKFLEFSKF